MSRDFPTDEPFLSEEEKGELVVDIHEVDGDCRQPLSGFFGLSSNYIFILELLLLLAVTVGNVVYHRQVVKLCNHEDPLIHCSSNFRDSVLSISN